MEDCEEAREVVNGGREGAREADVEEEGVRGDWDE